MIFVRDAFPNGDALANPLALCGYGKSVRSFVAMLIQTDRFGTPISKSLATFSDALRVERRQKAEEAAAKTTIKLLFPLALFIAPAMGIVLLGPAMISIVKSFQRIF